MNIMRLYSINANPWSANARVRTFQNIKMSMTVYQKIQKKVKNITFFPSNFLSWKLMLANWYEPERKEMFFFPPIIVIVIFTLNPFKCRKKKEEKDDEKSTKHKNTPTYFLQCCSFVLVMVQPYNVRTYIS